MTVDISGSVARQALFTRLAAKALPGEPLAGWDVSAKVPGELGQRCIYGGGRRFTHEDMVAESPGVMVGVTTIATVYIRAMNSGPDDDVDTEAEAEACAGIIAKLLKDEPNLGGGVGWQGIADGTGDYSDSGDDQIDIIALNVVLGRRGNYG